MADNDQDNDEFKFEEFDTLNAEDMGESDSATKNAQFHNQSPESGPKDVRRNVIIVIAIVVVLMLSYKFSGYLFSDKKEVAKPAIPPLVQTPPIQAPIVTQPIVQHVSEVKEAELSQKIAAIELSQDVMKSQVNSVNDRVTVLSDSVNNLNAQITKLNQILDNLSNEVAKQTTEINILISRTQVKQVKHVRKVYVKPNIYYVQATIPGRAWLIGTNGSTLTVREGTHIPGYGVVRLIDSTQGRVLTTSGKIIRFSQQDS